MEDNQSIEIYAEKVWKENGKLEEEIWELKKSRKLLDQELEEE